MEAFARKLKTARKAKKLTQTALAAHAGVTLRSIAGYENGDYMPKKNVVRALARVLGVSVAYLTQDEIDDPAYRLSIDHFAEEASDRFGPQGAGEMEELLRQNVSLFAGGTLSDDAKDLFYEALSKAYFACKEEARNKYGRKTAQQESTR